jgi:glycosyltransferase involved in cell wall biosynthesis
LYWLKKSAIYMAKMTAIVPCFNEEERIGKLLDNLQKQTLMPEIIIVDGGSSDRTLAIIRDYMKKNKNIRLMKERGKNRSPANARNIGWKAARGDIVYLMDVDSQIEEDFTKKVVKEFEKNPGVDAIKFVCHPYFPKRFSSPFEKALFYKDERGEGRLILFAKKAVDKLGYFDAGLGFGEDKIWARGWPKLDMVETKTALVQSKSGYLTFKKFFQRYSWYGRTMPRFLSKRFDLKIFAGLCIAVLMLFSTFLVWAHTYLFYLLAMLLALAFLRGVAIGLTILRKFGQMTPLLILPFTEILASYFVGIGFITFILGKRTIGR